MKKLPILLAVFFYCLNVNAQVGKKLGLKKNKTEATSNDGETSKGKEVLKRPIPTGNPIVDAFVIKTFNSFEELEKIQYAATFIKVNITEVEDTGDGVATEMMITTGDGKALTAENAIIQLKDLVVRLKKEDDNLKDIYNLKIPAANAVTALPLKQKMNGSRSYKTAVKAEGRLIAETKTLMQVLKHQISTIKSLM